MLVLVERLVLNLMEDIITVDFNGIEKHMGTIYKVERDTCTSCNWYITQSGLCKV